MTPKEIVDKLNKYIIGQYNAKKAVAIALRNRWRRMQLNKLIRNEIIPKNILMIGPTGVGKTEIARRISKISNAPFIKVEATKFTEVGYVGKDVDSIIRDLTDISFKMIKSKLIKKNKTLAKKIVEEKIIDLLIILEDDKLNINNNSIRTDIRSKLKKGLLEDKEIEFNLTSSLGIEIVSPPGMEEMVSQLQYIFKNISNQKYKTYKTKIKEARILLLEEESNKLLNIDEIKNKSIELVEQNGIVFIDEIDKICRSRSSSSGLDVSREGVQRDLLSIVEGCNVSTKHGVVKTDYILFIASGAFHNVSPTDLIPELQGRFPIKVKLESLRKEDFEKILTESHSSLINQYISLLSTEGAEIKFTEFAIKYISEKAWDENIKYENLGARRLYSILEKLMENISFNAHIYKGKRILIDKEYINLNLNEDNEINNDINKFLL
ncbi:ATP-dependent protease ATPase subunit HslU [endosymbiont of Sipalinus gigas]|nr:ATP-dependent protease ATPase subunit HslU [endosymbiont of Sipalinus gigas]